MLVLAQLDPCALERELLARIDTAHPREPGARTLVVVPTTRLAAHLQRRLADVRPAWVGLDVLHFQAIALRILDDAGENAPRLLSSRLCEAMLRGTLQAQQDNAWAEYTRRRPGTLRRLAASTRDLRESDTAPDELDEAARVGHAPQGERQRQDADDERDRHLARLYRGQVDALERAAARGWTDDAGLIRAALPWAAGWARRFGAIFLHGAYELIGIHVGLLQALDTGCPVTALLPAAPGYRVSEYADAFIDRSLGGTKTVERLPGPLPIEQRPDLTTLFDEESHPRPAGHFRFRHAQGVSAEVAVAVREALVAVRAGCPPAEIAITARSIEPYAAALERAFDEHGLPWTSSLQAPLARQPLARDFVLALRVVADDFPRGPTVELLRSPRLEWTRLTGDERPPSGARADAWSRGARILGGLDEWRDDLPAWVRESWSQPRREESPTELAERRERYGREARRIGAALAALHDRVRPASRRLSEHAARLATLVDEWFAPPDDAARAGLDDVLEEMDRLETVLGDERGVPFGEMVSLLDEAVRHARLPLRPRDDGGIRVLDAMQLRGLTFRHVHVLGLNSGMLPRPARRDPVLGDRLRERVRQRHGRPLAARSVGIAEDRLLLAQLLGAATDRVDVSWQRADESGRARSPSPMLREIARVAFGVPRVERIDERRAHLPSHPEHWLNALVERTGLLTPDEQALLLALESRGVATAREALAGHAELSAGLRMLGATQSFALPVAGAAGAEYDATVGPLTARALSVSALEDLGRCPLQFFFKHVLRVREIEEAADPFVLLPKEQGTRVHRVLERLYTTLDAEDLLERDDPHAAIARAEALLAAERDGILGTLDRKLARRLPLLHERIVGRWVATLQAFAAADLRCWSARHWRALGFERFVQQRIEAGGIVQELRGRFDRTVEGGDRILIGDYKASTSLDRRVDTKLMLRGLTLQVPLYAMLAGGEAVVELLGVHPDFDYAQGEDDEAPWRRSFEGLEGSIAEGFRETLGELLSALHEGEFPFDSGRHCDWCPYTDACRRLHPPSIERREASSRGLRLARLRKKTGKKPLLKDLQS